MENLEPRPEMIQVTLDDLPEGDTELMDYVSDDEDAAAVKKVFAEVEPPVQLDRHFTNALVVVGIPKVAASKYDKLLLVLEKKIATGLEARDPELVRGSFQIHMPLVAVAGAEPTDPEDPDSVPKESGGCAVMTFADAYKARIAAKFLNNFALDANHRFHCVPLDDFDAVISRDEKYEPPAKLPGFTRDQNRWFLEDPQGREQFVIRAEDDTEIFWHDDVARDPVLIYNGDREKQSGKRVWTDYQVQWSPEGSYLVTFHRPGIALWGGPIFEKKMRFEHRDVRQVLFSPNEEFVLTWDGSCVSVKNEHACCVWRVLTGDCLRTFPTPDFSPSGVPGEMASAWPHFLWSHDGKYLARRSEFEIFVYNTPDMSLTEDANGKKVPLKFGAADHPSKLEKFEWCPTANVLSVWLPEMQDSPGRLVLIQMPERREVASKNVYNVKEASFKWQGRGDYLSLNTTLQRKTGKKGKKDYTQIEIFRLREKDVPVDTIQIEDMKVKSLQWEKGPSPNRLAVIVQEEGTNKQSIRFYEVSSKGPKKDTQLVVTHDISGAINLLKWSPSGNDFVLAALGPDGALVFGSLTEQNKVDIYNRDEHSQVNSVQWDHSGRFVATAVTIPLTQNAESAPAIYRVGDDAGFQIWNFQGRLQHRTMRKKFYQFHWRPHPQSLLPPEKIDDFHRRLKEYSKKYDLQDEKIRSEKRAIYDKERAALTEAVLGAYRKKRQELEETEIFHEWQKAWNAFEEEQEWHEETETTQVVLSVTEEVIRK